MSLKHKVLAGIAALSLYSSPLHAQEFPCPKKTQKQICLERKIELKYGILLNNKEVNFLENELSNSFRIKLKNGYTSENSKLEGKFRIILPVDEGKSYTNADLQLMYTSSSSTSDQSFSLNLGTLVQIEGEDHKGRVLLGIRTELEIRNFNLFSVYLDVLANLNPRNNENSYIVKWGGSVGYQTKVSGIKVFSEYNSSFYELGLEGRLDKFTLTLSKTDWLSKLEPKTYRTAGIEIGTSF